MTSEAPEDAIGTGARPLKTSHFSSTFCQFSSHLVIYDNGDGSYTYNLVVSLPALTGMTSKTLHVTVKNGKITEMESENAGIEMNKEEGPVSGWAGLQNAMNNGGVVKLAADVIAESTDAALTVPEGKTVVLELNGFTINRNLAEGAKVSIAKAKAGMETYSYIKPVMPDPENYYVVAATLTIPANSYASYISDKGLELGMGTVNGVVLTSVKNVDAVAGTVTLFDALESAAAQTPLIIYNGTDEDQMVDLIVNENGAEVSYDAEHFFGTLEPKTFTPDDLAEADHYVLDGQNFTWVKDAGTLPANRCWLKVIPSSPNHARTMDIIFESDATDISSVNTNTATNNGPIYDLTGRKLSKKPTRGYYIQGGKKYVVK